MTLTSPELEQICTRLIAAQRSLARLHVRDIIAAIDAAAARLLDANEPERAAVLRSLEEVSGFSAPMARHLLDRACTDWRMEPLERLVKAEFGSTAPLEAFVRDGAVPMRRTRAVAPALALHVFSGNVPGVGTTSMVRSLLVRSAVLGKTAAAEPALAPAFVRLLRETNATVGAAAEAVYWPGGAAELESVALRYASLVVHYGSADAIADLRARVGAGVRFVEHGPRISFAVIDGRLLESTSSARNVARDVACAVTTFDQHGCVSPHVAYVVGEAEQARVLAAAVSAALAELETALPRGRLDAGAAAAIRELRTRAEFGSAEQVVWGTRHTVILSPSVQLEPSCLNRTLIVKHASAVADVVAAVQPFGDHLQTVGLAGFEVQDRDDIAGAFAAAGATRITSIAHMPWPPPHWHHDGRGPLRELVRWVDIEE